jgi:hypothetical protein
MTRRAASVFATFMILCGVPWEVGAQDDLKQEVAALRSELQQLRAIVEELKGSVGARPPAPAPQPPAEAAVELLQTQVAELSQVKVESASRMPVRISGTIHADAFFNTGEANWLENPNLVAARPADGRTGTFSMNLRQTRLGLSADGPTLGAYRTNGNLVFDFFGGIPGFQTGQVMGLPRLLVAFARIETDRTAFEIGQDQMVLAPRDPTSLAALSFPLLFRSGNLYLRTPQVRVERSIASHVRVAGAIVAPIGGDLADEQYRFVPPALAGERSRRPGVQARLGVGSSADTDATRSANVGVSGHYGWERRGEALADSWAGAIDVEARRDWIGVAGEAFAGENVDAFGGGTGVDSRAGGGWAELRLFPSALVSLNAGVGVDELRNPRLGVARRRNRSAFGNVIVSVTPELQASFEYRFLETLPGAGIDRRNHHFDWVLAYKF